MTTFTNPKRQGLALGAALLMSTSLAQADQVFADDLIVEGSACIGIDCSNGESFGFDTLRLKENNLRIKFQDTSNSASFPTNDWQLTANDSSNGGANKFSIDDIDNGRTPFTIQAGARTNALFVSATGRVGFGTDTPVVDLHVRQGNSPTLRLEQDGSSGFASQTWDLAGNETNFFIRDVTNGSELPFKVFPGADSNALIIGANSNVGVGTANSPSAPLHVRRTDGTANLLIEEANGTADARGLLTLRNNGQVFMSLEDSSIIDGNDTGRIWNFQNVGGEFRVTTSPGGADEVEMNLDVDGNMTIEGNYFAASGTQLTVPDYVFAPDYDLKPLSEVQAFITENSHLPDVPSAAEIADTGLNMTDMQMRLLKKVEELTLYTLAQEGTIAAQADAMAAMQNRMDMLEHKLTE